MSNNNRQTTPEKIDQLLPQTQCGLCGYNGCKPYAEAIANQGERIDYCLPGGLEVLQAIGAHLNEDPKPYETEMKQKAKPAMKAVIREDECIGCTKCIQACPVDAIFGASKRMHTVISEECTGCELCVEPCPVDCIDMVEVAESSYEDRRAMADKARRRYEARLNRQTRQQQNRRQNYERAKLTGRERQQTMEARKSIIQDAVKRAKAKKQAKRDESKTS